ncbi:MAG: alcohol dehydrogenase [Spirochaetes bacterium GWF1_51_8]|nr:MAG: alcohol dehydrogenase [Spirochaetes bacterium GWF1_51_8]
MKSIVFDNYGPPEVLRYIDAEKPVPEDGEVLVKVHASSVNFNNLTFVIGKPYFARFWTGLTKPKVRTPGNDIAGTVESAGGNVTMFKPGDEVYGDIFSCGYGAYSEYVSVPESMIAFKPKNISFEEAATVPEAAKVALQALRDGGKIEAGMNVLIYGAAGGIGTFAVQIAKSYGAEVTGVCGTRNMDMVRSIGADHVIDYTTEDFTKNGRSYDLIVATAGYRSIFDYKRALSPHGIYVATGGSMKGPNSMKQIFQPMLLGPWISRKGGKKLSAWSAKLSREDLDVLGKLIEAGKVKPVIDRTYLLSRTADAFRYYAEGHANGKIVIRMEHELSGVNAG